MLVRSIVCSNEIYDGHYCVNYYGNNLVVDALVIPEKMLEQFAQKLLKKKGGSKLKVGDVVVLNSGGPDMTVTDLEITCVWFNGGETEEATFSEASLTIKEEN